MLSCKNCGAQMSGIDLVCKNCGTPWGKKHKSRKRLYFSFFIILVIGIASYICYVPGAKENFMNLYTKTLSAITKKEEPKTPSNTEEPKKVPEPNNEIIPPEVTEPEEQPVPPKEGTPSNPEPPVFTWISASSSLKDYPPENTTDGKLETAWLEGVKGNGIGEWIMYSAEKEQTVSSITIYNGYLKNDKVYINNGRIKKISLEFSDGEIITKDIAKTNFSNAKNGFKINLDTPKATTSVKLTILSAYQGAYYTDTALSGVTFN